MPSADDAIRIHSRLAIPRDEVSFATSRSGGPGGQNVNKVETRVTLLFDIERSRALAEAQKARLRERLASRIAGGSVLKVTAQRHRSQAKNRDAAVERFAGLVRDALAVAPARKKTRPTAAARAERLDEKRRNAALKRDRRRPPAEE